MLVLLCSIHFAYGTVYSPDETPLGLDFAKALRLGAKDTFLRDYYMIKTYQNGFKKRYKKQETDLEGQKQHTEKSETDINEQNQRQGKAIGRFKEM